MPWSTRCCRRYPPAARTAPQLFDTMVRLLAPCSKQRVDENLPNPGEAEASRR